MWRQQRRLALDGDGTVTVMRGDLLTKFKYFSLDGIMPLSKCESGSSGNNGASTVLQHF